MEKFTYSKAERDRITSNACSLLGDNGDIETGDWATLLNAHRNKAKYNIHASSLNDYLKANMIPRGLRIQKGPEMFKSNDTFLQKWKAILNQCSTDLMLLIMEYALQTVEDSSKEITDLESKLQNDNESEFENKMKKIKEEIDALERNMKEFKIRKYKRDTKDYANEAVYNFKPRPFAKKVTWASSTYSDYDSAEAGDSSATSGDEGPSYREKSNRETRERAAKGRANEAFFRARPQRKSRRKAS